jgi:hypothetical protein
MLYSYINYINLLPWLVIFQILMFADCLLNRSVKGLTRGKWLVVMFLLQGFGSFIYFAFAPSILFTTFLNGLVSLKQNATAIQIFIYCQQQTPALSTQNLYRNSIPRCPSLSHTNLSSHNQPIRSHFLRPLRTSPCLLSHRRKHLYRPPSTTNEFYQQKLKIEFKPFKCQISQNA